MNKVHVVGIAPYLSRKGTFGPWSSTLCDPIAGLDTLEKR
jgi:hypothetical protein